METEYEFFRKKYPASFKTPSGYVATNPTPKWHIGGERLPREEGYRYWLGICGYKLDTLREPKPYIRKTIKDTKLICGRCLREQHRRDKWPTK